MITIKAMDLKDADSVSKIEKACFGSSWTLTPFQRELNNSNCFYFTAYYKDSIIGYSGYWMILEEAHITSVAVLPMHRKKGVAQQLLFHLIDHCIEKQAQWITLEVKETNIPAIKLYEKFGFKVMGTRKNYYQQDNKDAYIMWTDNIRETPYRKLLEDLKGQEILT